VLKPWRREQWCLPTVSAAFVWRMEDILDLYAEPYARRYPVVCFDESPYQLVSETRQPLPVAPGRPTRYDYEYRREGTCNLFLFFQPLAGWRHVEVTARRTAQDFAQCMKALVDVHFPKAALISVVLDNLNTHTPAALYEAFPPAEARRILSKLDLRYTPKHGSWLNMAEVEFAVLADQCLDRRLPARDMVRQEVGAWEASRNAVKATVQWQFTTAKARIKLRRLYPS
jgi:DDE superfamily endonuclease